MQPRNPINDLLDPQGLVQPLTAHQTRPQFCSRHGVFALRETLADSLYLKHLEYDVLRAAGSVPPRAVSARKPKTIKLKM
jgi:hypothetical protein